jgi:hypothetical protein
MRTLIQQVADELQKRGFENLAKIPEHSSTKQKFEGKDVTVSIWRDRISDVELQIVVQSYRHWALGVGKMDATGFRITKNGDVRELRRNEIYEFF